MANLLTHLLCRCPYGVFVKAFMACVLMSACDDQTTPPQNQPLSLPERTIVPHVSDQVTVAGKTLALWDDGGGCKLQVGRAAPTTWLKPTSPCYFVKSPGTNQVQIYQHDKSTTIIAVVGTPAKGERCGQEVQGLVMNAKGIHPSTYVAQGSVYCAGQGLYNFQYNLFAKEAAH